MTARVGVQVALVNFLKVVLDLVVTFYSGNLRELPIVHGCLRYQSFM